MADRSKIEWTQLRPDKLDQPLRWRKPRRVFVNSMSDLFHADIPDEYIARVFAVMALAPQHTFQCLTKRHGRMRSLLNSQAFRHQVAQQVDNIRVDLDHPTSEAWVQIPGYGGYEASTHGRIRSERTVLATGINPRTGREAVTLWNNGQPKTLPVHRLVLLAHDPRGAAEGMQVCHRNGNKLDNRRANLRWGTHSENQSEKVRHGARGGPQRLTLEDVASIRIARESGRTQQSVADEYGVSRSLVSMIASGKVWAQPDIPWPLPNLWVGVSVEDQRWADVRGEALRQTPAAVRFVSAEPLLGPITTDLTGIDWVIVGGESGRGARPMHIEWARSLRDQCQAAGVPYFFKQWGEWAPVDQAIRYNPPSTGRRSSTGKTPSGGHRTVYLDREGGSRTTNDLTTFTIPSDWVRVARVGKTNAGRGLDGRTWDQYPSTRP